MLFSCTRNIQGDHFRLSTPSKYVSLQAGSGTVKQLKSRSNIRRIFQTPFLPNQKLEGHRFDSCWEQSDFYFSEYACVTDRKTSSFTLITRLKIHLLHFHHCAKASH